MKWFVKGDFDGFFGLGLNNFINFLLIINLSLFVLGFDVEFVAKRILPAMAVGILTGNFCRPTKYSYFLPKCSF